MNAELLLEHFHRISDAPDAVSRLRRFILDLAVRGKLVPQDPNDEPASALLKRIAAEKARLVKFGAIRDRAELPQITQNPYELPIGWDWCRLGTLGVTQTGTTPPKSNKNYYGDYIPFVKPADLLPSGVVYNNERLSKEGFEASGRIAGAGSILMVCIGTIGKCQLIERECSFNQQINSLSPFEGLVSRYLLFAFQADYFQRAAWGSSARTTIAILNKGNWELIPFPLPPLAEQHRIVAKVDELMALCDRLEAARTEREAKRDRLTAASLTRLNTPDPDPDTFADHARFVLDNLSTITARRDQVKQLRQTILNLAVRGKLVPQDPNDKPVSVLLHELHSAKHKLHDEENIRDRKALTGISRTDLAFDIPVSWELSKFDDVFVIISGVTKGRNLSGQATMDVPYLRVANVQRGYLDLSIVKNITIRDDELDRYRLLPGDVVMTEGGDWDKLGRAAIWFDDLPVCVHQNHIFRVRSPDVSKLLPHWVIIYTNSLLGRSFFENASKQTTNLASINMTQLRGCPLPLPPTAEQHRIVAKVDELMTLCDRLEASIGGSDDTRSRLLSALLHDALSEPEADE